VRTTRVKDALRFYSVVFVLFLNVISLQAISRFSKK